MASFDEHIQQAKSNFTFLEFLNKSSKNVDWQITVAYYVSVHLVNAHIAKYDLHYLQHKQVYKAINPENQLAICPLDMDFCVKFRKLTSLSRASRYLCHESENKRGQDEAQGVAYFVKDKHLAKAIRTLDFIINFFEEKYGIDFPEIAFFCNELGLLHGLKHFKSQATVKSVEKTQL